MALKRKICLFPTLVTVLSATIACTSPVFAEQVNSSEFFIPWTFTAYDEPSLFSDKKGLYGPQTVTVIEMTEDGWGLIDTDIGGYWVYLADDLLYMDVYTPVFDEKDGQMIFLIEPQVIKILKRDGDWLLIDTWVGERWISLTYAAKIGSCYISENAHIYENFRANNPSLPYETVIAYVNANVDMSLGSVLPVHNYNDITALVNKNFVLPSDYVPNDLTDIGGGLLLRSEAADMLYSLRQAARDAGYTFHVASAYRSYARQNNLAWRSSGFYIAKPGHSEHQLGLVVDMLHRPVSGTLGSAQFERTQGYAWLTEHAHEYGFILRYPKEYSHIHGYGYEPWHWRYVGIEAASAMHYEGITTFEEYYGKYLAPGISGINK